MCLLEHIPSSIELTIEFFQGSFITEKSTFWSVEPENLQKSDVSVIFIIRKVEGRDDFCIFYKRLRYNVAEKLVWNVNNSNASVRYDGFT